MRIEDSQKLAAGSFNDDAVVILEVFEKKSQATPKSVIAICKKRIIAYDRC